jgi:hypothetical protein
MWHDSSTISIALVGVAVIWVFYFAVRLNRALSGQLNELRKLRRENCGI